jgi:hypothetical protein
LRAPAIETANFNVFEQGVFTLFLLYAVRELHFSPALVGRAVAAAGVGFVAYGTVPIGSLLGVCRVKLWDSAPLLWVMSAGLLLGPPAILFPRCPIAGSFLVKPSTTYRLCWSLSGVVEKSLKSVKSRRGSPWTVFVITEIYCTVRT